MREAHIQGRVVQYARRAGVIGQKLAFGQGWPDFMFLYRGNTMFIEFKSPYGRTTTLQEHMRRVLMDQGFPVHVINDIEEGKARINEFIQLTEAAISSKLAGHQQRKK